MDRQRTQAVAGLEQKLNSLYAMSSLSSEQITEVDMTRPTFKEMGQRKFIRNTKKMFDMR